MEVKVMSSKAMKKRLCVCLHEFFCSFAIPIRDRQGDEEEEGVMN